MKLPSQFAISELTEGLIFFRWNSICTNNPPKKTKPLPKKKKNNLLLNNQSAEEEKIRC